MPYTKLQKGNSRVDWFIAAVLWKKAVTGVTWEQLSEKVGVNPHTLRHWCVSKPSSQWQVYALKKTLKELGLSYMEILSMMEDDS